VLFCDLKLIHIDDSMCLLSYTVMVAAEPECDSSMCCISDLHPRCC